MTPTMRALAVAVVFFPTGALAQAGPNPCPPGEDVCLALIDQDGSGDLNQGELETYMAESGDASQAAAQVLQDYDTNGDAEIDKSEFGPGIADDLDPISSTPSYNL